MTSELFPLKTSCLSYLLFILSFSAKFWDCVDFINSASICRPNYLTLVTIDLRQSSNTRGTVISSTSSSCFKSVLLYILQNFKVNDLRAFTSLNAECLTESLASSDINANEVKNIILYSFEISCHFLVCAYIKSVRHRHAA